MLGAGLTALLLAIYAWRHRNRIEIKVFAWLMVAVGLWSITYGLEIGSTDFDRMKLLLVMSYPGIATIPVLWLIFVVAYCRYDAWLKPRRILPLFIVPVVTVALVVTNDFHGLYYHAVTRGVVDGYRFQALGFGPFWWLHVGYSHAVVVIGMALFARRYFKASLDDRRRIMVFMVGAALPFAVNLAYVAGFRPYGFIDSTPVAFAGMGIILAVGVFSVRVFDMTPLALDVLFQHIPDAIYMLDTNQRIVKTNPPARRLSDLRGSPAGGAHGVRVPDDTMFFPVAPGESDLTIGDQFYHCSVSLIRTTSGKVIGTLVVMRDITIRKKAEQEKELTIKQLRQALLEIKSLRGIIPICASCKKIRNDKGYWEQVEAYISKHSEAEFSHGICPQCLKTLYGEEEQA